MNQPNNISGENCQAFHDDFGSFTWHDVGCTGTSVENHLCEWPMP